MDKSGISNFTFLQEHDPVFYQLAHAAEQLFPIDPNASLIKLRLLGEALAQHIALRCGILFDERTTQAELLFKIEREFNLDQSIRSLFHLLRVEGNKAAHDFRADIRHRDAMSALKVARDLALWFHKAFGKAGAQFNPGPFIPPQDPSQQLRRLHDQITQLQAQLERSQQTASAQQQLAELRAQEAEEYAALAQQMQSEAKVYEELALEQEQALNQSKQQFQAQLQQLQQQLKQQQEQGIAFNTGNLGVQMRQAASQLSLSEDVTRILIDQQLQEAGWDADTETLTWQKGARPEKNRNKAIAEWPTAHNQRADYVLFVGLTPAAVVEAKRENTDVAGKIPQAERYALGFKPTPDMITAWLIEGRTIAWPDSQDGHYQIPFVYSCNGRPYFKQLEQQSGIWFRDLRHHSNTARALPDFHTPAGLLDLLKRNKAAAEQKLTQEGFHYLKLRDYQQSAIQAIETALANNQRNCLLAMATGTGKTRTILGLIYRFLKAERFKRILFLVDRTALGTQADDTFEDTVLEQNLTLAKAYNIAKLGDMAPEAETRLQIATVQAMVKRIFQSDDPLPIDTYDCIIVDEAHRGYTLDQDMTEGEMWVRDQNQYLSTYRRVLDYFDAVKIGLTATPAKHTTDIFGRPVFTYSYREAVADDWLIDHEPPICYDTLLNTQGIKFEKGEQVSVVNTITGAVESAELEDEMNFEVEAFNRRVITPDFNRVICEQLAQELDLTSPEKTLIFCTNQRHAEMVKSELDIAFKHLYEEDYDQASVQIITGKTDKYEQKIKAFKNESKPKIAITVDLLTTGIDVPAICHLVFLRRVKSRILYEQMKGRATRRCDDIGKTVFRIYDPVDLYKALEPVDTMKPLVKDPNVTLEQLVQELHDLNSYQAPGSSADKHHADDVLDQLNQKIMRVLRKATHRAHKDETVRTKLAELENLWGVEPAKLHNHLHTLGPQQAAQFITQHHNLIRQLADVNALLGSDRYPLVSEHQDQLLARRQTYGVKEQPADYLESFNDFIKRQLNQHAALSAVVNKPKDLTRQQLKEIRLLLDSNGYSEASLKTAWRNQTNQDIAASIIGYIRRAALGEALIPFEQRVHTAMQRIYAQRQWTPVQRQWLDRLAKRLVHEVILDQATLNDAFANDGGAKRLDKMLEGQLPAVLADLAEHLWDSA